MGNLSRARERAVHRGIDPVMSVYEHNFYDLRLAAFLLVEDGLSCTELVKRKDITTCVMLKYLFFWEECGFITREKKGRCKKITLTQKGRDLRDAILRLQDIVTSN